MPVVSGTEVDGVVHAVRAIHDIATPNEQRIYYTQAIENLKEGSPFSSVETAFYLICHGEQSVRHVGWNIIEHIIRYKWVEIDFDLRIKIRNAVLGHVSQGEYSLGSADSLIKISISRSIVFMMENEWPQNWPELFPQFRQVISNSNPKLYPQCQMIFIVLKRLIEDVVTLATIENAVKRRELSTAISTFMRDILNMCISKIQSCIENVMNEDSILLAKSIIELLSEIVEWVINKILEDFVDAIVDVMCAYLQIELFGIYEDAAKCLWKLASRKNLKAQEAPIVVSMFRDNPIQTILSAANVAAEVSSSSINHYKYLKALCDLLCALGVHLSDVWSFLPVTPPNFNVYLSAISSFFVHPSVYIRAETAQVISAFSAHEKISKNSDFVNCITSLFQYLPRCMEKSGVIGPQGFVNNGNNLTTQYSRMDYDDDDELLRDFLSLRERCCKIIRDSTVSHFDKFFAIINDWIINRFVSQTEIIDADEFDMLKRFINTCLQSANQFGVIRPDVRKSFVSLFDVILAQICTLKSPKTTNGALSILSAFFQIFDDCPDRMPAVFSRFKVLLMLKNQNNENLDILSLKRHCIVLLLKIISLYPLTAKPFAQTVLDLVIGVADHVSVMQRASLVHVLGALSNLAESSEEQHIFLQNATPQNIQYLKSQNYLTCISSAANFFTYIGLTSAAPSNEIELQTSIYYNNRLELRSNLFAIEGLIQQVNSVFDQTNPLFTLLQSIIPSFFQLARCLNSIYCAENIALIHPSFSAKVLDITSQERQIIHFSMLETEIKEQNLNGNSNDPIVYTRRYLLDLTDLIQNILGLIGSKFPLQFYGNSAQVIGSCFDASELMCATLYCIENVPDCRTRFWIRRTWNKLICSCPQYQSKTVLKFMIALTRHFHQLIGDRWNVVQNRSEETEPTKEELFFESVTSVLCREYAIFLKNVVMGETPSHKGTKKDSVDLLNAFGRELLSNKEILDNVIASLAKLINCPDTQAAVKAVPVANIIVGNYFAEFDEQMAIFLLVHTIQSLQIHGPDDVILGPLLSLIFHIYSVLRPIYPLLMNLLNQIPGSVPEIVLNFDNRVMTMVTNKEKLIDKNKRDLMRKILKPVIALNIAEQHKRPVKLRSVKLN